MATVREENRAEVEALLADEPEALAWLQEHWAETGTQGGGQRMGAGMGGGQGAGQGGMGMGNRAQQGAGAES